MKSDKIIKIKGGLGNQMFQYAYGLKLSHIDKQNVIFDTSFFENTGNDIIRPFLLKRFNITLDKNFQNIRKNKIIKIINKIKQKISGQYEYYQSEKYFTEVKYQIIKEYTLKEKFSSIAENVLNSIKLQDNSVSLHIRRGDYVKNPAALKHHGVCALDYYYEAEKYIKSKINNPIFFIFSDDIAWARKNLKIENCVFVSNPQINENEELILMSKCKHNIIANSTFSWWGAYLNTNTDKIIIAPKQWTVKKTSDDLDILPKNWIQL